MDKSLKLQFIFPKVQAAGEEIGDMFEISTVRREDWDFVQVWMIYKLQNINYGTIVFSWVPLILKYQAVEMC